MSQHSHELTLPKFSNFDAEKFPAILDKQLKESLNQIESILSNNSAAYTWDNVMRPLENIEDALERLWTPFSHLHAAVNSEELRKCHERCMPLLVAYESSVSHNNRLFDAISTIDSQSLAPVQQKIIDDMRRDFVLSGVNLAPDAKKRFEAIQKRLSELSSQFENNLLDAENYYALQISDEADLAGVPELAKENAREQAKSQGQEGWLFNLQYPSFSALITYAENRALREEIYSAYITRASERGESAGKFDNSAIMDEILALRHEKALLLGYNNYAELSLADKMAESSDQVMAFLLDLADRAHHQAEGEYAALAEFAKEHYQIDRLKPWDLAFISEKKQQFLFQFSQEDLRPYFGVEKAFEGMFEIAKRLYRVSFKPLQGMDVWHPDVRCFALHDEDDSIRGIIYVDLYARAAKRSGAWMDALQTRRIKDDGSLQLPVASLTCNFSKPSGDKPATLLHDELVTMFHEFGHCLHHVLTKVDYLEASGIHGVAWDAVELPSQFFENWCWEAPVLQRITAHVETDEPLPESLYKKLITAKNFQSAMALMRQIEFSLFDFRIHLEYQVGINNFIMDTLDAVREKTAVAPVYEFNRFPHSFSHIFSGGYAAGYYSYKWAEVLSSDAFSRFEEEGIFNEKTGHDFLHCILEAGGSIPAMEAYIAFRGRKAKIDALLRHNGIKS